MKYILTCSDVIKALAREDITVTASSLDEAWDKAKVRFARKYKTSKLFVNITAVEMVE